MKRAKKLTRQQKILLSKKGYDPKQFLLVYESGSNAVFVHKDTGEEVQIET